MPVIKEEWETPEIQAELGYISNALPKDRYFRKVIQEVMDLRDNITGKEIGSTI